jgi:hypothetical protein
MPRLHVHQAKKIIPIGLPMSSPRTTPNVTDAVTESLRVSGPANHGVLEIGRDAPPISRRVLVDLKSSFIAIIQPFFESRFRTMFLGRPERIV